MRIRLIQASELDDGLIRQWRCIQGQNANLRSPYYCPEYTQVVDASLRAKGRLSRNCSPFAEVAIIESDTSHQVQGFFPFQRGPWGRILSVGGGLTDYQGIICSDDFAECRAAQLLSAIQGRYFAFNHLPLTGALFSSAVKIKHESPVLNTEGGYDSYLERLKNFQGTPKPGVHAEVRKRSNKIVRELGPLRFEKHEQSNKILQRLIQLKIAQWKIGAPPNTVTAFEIPWINHVIHSLLERNMSATDKGVFKCALSTLYAGDKLLAIQFSLRHEQTLHCWFPAYEPEFASYSGGTVLVKPLTEEFAADGIGLIDMGRGAATYKMRVCTGVVPLGEGACSSPAVLAKGVVAARVAVRSLRQRFLR
jgi:CelD/BcsL family acetyltransferase involved in cellulose biosynthesis